MKGASWHETVQQTGRNRIPNLEQLHSTQKLLRAKEEEIQALTTQYTATHDKLILTQEHVSNQQQALSHLQYTAQQTEEQFVRENRALKDWVETLESKIPPLEQAKQAALKQIPYLEQQLQSTQQLLHTKEKELEALSTQYRVTHELLQTQEQFSTQQQVLSDLQCAAEQKEEQLQARGRENVALTDWVETLESKIPPLEQANQAALKQIPYLEQQLQSKQAQLLSLTEETHLQNQVKPKIASVSTQTESFSMQPTQVGLQAGAVGIAELQIQHAKLQQKVTGDTELLLPVNDEKKQPKTFQEDKHALQEDQMDREEEIHHSRMQQIQFRDTSTENMVDTVDKPGTSLTGKQKHGTFFLGY